MSLGLAAGLLGLVLLALGLLLVPLLLRRPQDASRGAYNLAVYRDQLAEVERDLGRGLLSPEQAEAARTEIGRRMLASSAPVAEPGDRSPGSVAAACVAVLALPLVAVLLYARLGSPGLPDQPLAERKAAAAGTTAAQTDPGASPGASRPIDIADALRRLRAHLKDHGEDLTSWLLLARTEASLGELNAAAEAYQHAAELSGRRPDILGEWGEAMVLAAGGTVAPAAREAFEGALADKANAPRARYYLALAKLQQGDAKAALQAWVDLAGDAPAGAEWLPLVQQRIAATAATLGIDPASVKTSSGAPSPAAVAATAAASAALSPEQRQEMIETMVAALAARLEKQPNDPEGWVRLGRSYMVLNRPDKARDAYAHAVQLRPDDRALREAYAVAEQEAASASRR